MKSSVKFQDQATIILPFILILAEFGEVYSLALTPKPDPKTHHVKI